MGTTITATTTNHNDLSKNTQDGYAAVLEDEVQCLVGGISEKFVPEPLGEDILTDVIQGIQRFTDAVRWKAYHKAVQEEKEKATQSGINTTYNNQVMEEKLPTNSGLNTNLKPTKINLSAPRADDEIESFLLQLKEELITQALGMIDAKGTNKTSHRIKRLQQKLRNNNDQVVVPTDKPTLSELYQ